MNGISKAKSIISPNGHPSIIMSGFREFTKESNRRARLILAAILNGHEVQSRQFCWLQLDKLKNDITREFHWSRCMPRFLEWESESTVAHERLDNVFREKSKGRVHCAEALRYSQSLDELPCRLKRVRS